MTRLANVALIGCALLACARAYPPSGGDPDREPPRLVATQPEAEAVVPDWKDEVVFSFDETLSENGVRGSVMVSPETGAVNVDRDGSRLKVKLDGGWRPNTVYRVIVLPRLQDRFRNTRRDPVELVFSTGPALIPTAIAGLVTDRITGLPLADARVIAVAQPDSVVHSTVTDTAGFFGLRFLPAGNYFIQAYDDRNRNLRLDRAEARAERTIALTTAQDTQVIELAALPFDSTPARLARAEARDSVELRLIFDDYLDPDQRIGSIRFALYQLPDSTQVDGVRLLTAAAADSLRARQDSIARAAQERDTTARAQPPVPPPPSRAALLPGRSGEGARAQVPQELALLARTPLKPGPYRVEIQGVRNIAGIAGGGGSVRFTLAARDTAGVRRDTLPVRRDTVPVRRDTIPRGARLR